MMLKEIIKGLDHMEIIGNIEKEITSIAYDSRKVKKGALFVCISGFVTDGHQYINDAISNGATALLVEKPMESILPLGIIPEDVSVIRIKDTRYGMASVSDAFFRHPSSQFQLVGVTGTKGKTTTTFMIKAILEASRQKTGLVGTVANMIGEQVLYAEKTTPESCDLQSLFSDMVSAGVDSVIMEVSSQGLSLDRVSQCDFDIGVFTNLYQDHIGHGEHASMADYLAAKTKLFKMCKKGIINIDSPYGDAVRKEAQCEVFTMGIDQKADITAVAIVKNPMSIAFRAVTPWFEEDIVVNIPGTFNVYNALAAIAVCGLLGISKEDIKAGLSKVQVPGRIETVVTGRDFTIIIDYAHNAESLSVVLKAVREFAPARVVCVFGCGGDKAKDRRFGMGEVSGNLADLTIITSDNPRTEDPNAIIENIETGMKKTDGKYIKITDRTEAIRYAIQNAMPKDIIILAGKGHETTQIFAHKTIHYDEREVVCDILKEMEKNV